MNKTSGAHFEPAGPYGQPEPESRRSTRTAPSASASASTARPRYIECIKEALPGIAGMFISALLDDLLPLAEVEVIFGLRGEPTKPEYQRLYR